MSTLNEISQMVVTGQVRTIKAKVQQALNEGISAQNVLDDGLLPGINEIGEKFAKNEVFVPNVLLAAKVMNMGVEVIQPLLAAGESTKVGTAVVGTVKGDLHDIGKNLVRMMMEGKGLEVVDLGVDVSPEQFIDAAKNQGCQIICCSALLTTTMGVMSEVVEAAKTAGIRDSVKIMVGGAPVTEAFCQQVGADCYTADAASAAEAAVELLA